MIDDKMRVLKERLLYRPAAFIGNYLSPNAISILAFSAGMLTAAAILLHNLPLALVLWIINRILDGLDGTVARHTGRSSDFGGYLDILLDFIVYATVPLAMTLHTATATADWILLALLLGVFYINAASWMYLSALLEKRRRESLERILQKETSDTKQNPDETERQFTTVAMPGGLVEGTETILLYTLFFIFPSYLQLLYALLTAGTTIGIMQRIVWAKKRFAKPSAP